MSKADLKKFRQDVTRYMNKHPHVHFRTAQKRVSNEWKRKPAAKRKRHTKKRVKARKKKVSGVRTVSKTHTDKNRFKNVDIQIGSVRKHIAHAKKGLTLQYEKEQGRLLHARTKTAKKKIHKRIRTIRSKMNRLTQC